PNGTNDEVLPQEINVFANLVIVSVMMGGNMIYGLTSAGEVYVYGLNTDNVIIKNPNRYPKGKKRVIDTDMGTQTLFLPTKLHDLNNIIKISSQWDYASF